MQAYNLVDVNLCDDEKLLKDNMIISKAMLIEKSKTKENVVSNFKSIIKKLSKQKKFRRNAFYKCDAKLCIKWNIRPK